MPDLHCVVERRVRARTWCFIAPPHAPHVSPDDDDDPVVWRRCNTNEDAEIIRVLADDPTLTRWSPASQKQLTPQTRAVLGPTSVPYCLACGPRAASLRPQSFGLLLSELLRYPWSRQVEQEGYVDLIGYGHYLTEGRPDYYTPTAVVQGSEMAHVVAPATMRRSWTALTPKRQQLLLGLRGPDSGSTHVTQVHWTCIEAQTLPVFHGHLLPQLQQYGSPDRVRLILWWA